MEGAEHRSRIDTQLASRCHLHLAYGRLRLLEIRQEPLAAFVVGAAHLGQVHFPGRAVEQSRPEPLFELFDVLAHHARRDAEAR